MIPLIQDSISSSLHLSNHFYIDESFPTTHPPNHVLVNEYHPMEGIMPIQMDHCTIPGLLRLVLAVMYYLISQNVLGWEKARWKPRVVFIIKVTMIVKVM